MELWGFDAPFRIAGTTRAVWIAGGLATYRKWIGFARERDLLMPWVISPVAYDGPADRFMDLPWGEQSREAAQ